MQVLFSSIPHRHIIANNGYTREVYVLFLFFCLRQLFWSSSVFGLRTRPTSRTLAPCKSPEPCWRFAVPSSSWFKCSVAVAAARKRLRLKDHAGETKRIAERSAQWQERIVNDNNKTWRHAPTMILELNHLEHTICQAWDKQQSMCERKCTTDE